jgi:hypothetical protein
MEVKRRIKHTVKQRKECAYETVKRKEMSPAYSSVYPRANCNSTNKVLANVFCSFKMLLEWVSTELCQLSYHKSYVRACTNYEVQQQTNNALVLPKQFW